MLTICNSTFSNLELTGIYASLNMKDLCENIPVNNDCAERCIKDCQGYAKAACTPELREGMITVAQDHR